MGREGGSIADRNLDVNAEALSTSSSIGGVFSALTFAALVVYIAFTERTFFQNAVIISLTLTTVLFILASIQYSIALDRLAAGLDERPAVRVAERMIPIAFTLFFVSLGLIAFNLDLVLGVVVAVLITAIVVVWVRAALKLWVWSCDV